MTKQAEKSDPYGDGSGHTPCPECGFCSNCGDCTCHGCGEPGFERALASVNSVQALAREERKDE